RPPLRLRPGLRRDRRRARLDRGGCTSGRVGGSPETAKGAPSMTVSSSLDERIRSAAAAAGLLHGAFHRIGGPPRGRLLVGVSERGVCRISFDSEPEHHLELLARQFGPRILRSSRPVDHLRRELDEYFAGRRRHFDLQTDVRLLPAYNRAVLAELARVE